MFSVLPEAIKQHFLDSSLPGALPPPLERTLCLPAPPHPLPAPVLNGGLSALQGRRAHRAPGHGSGAVCGLCLAGRLDLSPAPRPLPTPAADRALGPRRPSPCCPHSIGGRGWKSGPAQPFSNERPPHRPLCGVIKLLALPSSLPGTEHCPCHSYHKGPLCPFIFY